MGGVIEHGIGGDQRYAGPLGEFRQRRDVGFVAAAIRVSRSEIEARPRRCVERLRNAPKLLFDISLVMPANGAGPWPAR